jgi:hypothetical protein
MDTRHRTYRLALAVVALTAHPAMTEAQIVVTAPLVLQVYGLTTLPPGVGDRAQDVVDRIYSAAGTRVAWRLAGTGTPEIPGGFQVSVIFRRQSEADAPLAVLGFAPAPRGRLVYVLYDHVEAFAIANHLDIGHALGHVIAHEVGHVLLPGRAHSRSGLMRSNLDYQLLRVMPHGELTFTASEAMQIRTRLTTTGNAVVLNTRR